jgi:hypothetical protein
MILRLRKSVGALCLFLFLNGGSPVSAAEENPELGAVVQKLAAGIEKGDEPLAQAQFTRNAWEREEDSGRSLYGQGTRKRFELRLTGTQVRGERAVATVDVNVAGKAVDRVYLYLVRQSGRWLVDGIDENRGHHEPFLLGQVPALFRVEALPSSPELLALGTLLTDAASGKPGASERLHAQIVDTSSVGYLNLAELRGASCKAAHFSEPLGKVALVFERAPDARSPAPERIFLYLQKQPDRWHVYSRSYGHASARSMLPETRFYLKSGPAGTDKPR